MDRLLRRQGFRTLNKVPTHALDLILTDEGFNVCYIRVDADGNSLETKAKYVTDSWKEADTLYEAIMAAGRSQVLTLLRKANIIKQNITDAELLDWCEEQAKKSRTGISFDHHPTAGFRFMRRGFLGEGAKTLREAIKSAQYVAAGGPFSKDE